MTKDDVLAAASVKDAAGLTNPPSRAYTYTANFDATLAANSNTQAQTNIERDWIFQTNEFAAELMLAAALSSSVIRSPVSRRGDPSSSSNTMPNLSHFRVQIKSAQGELFDQPIRLSMIASTAELQRFLINPWIFPAGSLVTTTLYNDSAVGVTAQFGFVGLRVSAK